MKNPKNVIIYSDISSVFACYFKYLFHVLIKTEGAGPDV